MSTAVLLIVLGQIYDKYWGFFAFLIVLDIVSHWYQMQCKAMQNKKSHKGSKNPVRAPPTSHLPPPTSHLRLHLHPMRFCADVRMNTAGAALNRP
jgi:hypothetical protein